MEIKLQIDILHKSINMYYNNTLPLDIYAIPANTPLWIVSKKSRYANLNDFEDYTSLQNMHCKYIYMYKTIQARVNTVANPTTGKCRILYWELLHPILGIPLASIGKLPFIGKLPIEA